MILYICRYINMWYVCVYIHVHMHIYACTAHWGFGCYLSYHLITSFLDLPTISRCQPQYMVLRLWETCVFGRQSPGLHHCNLPFWGGTLSPEVMGLFLSSSLKRVVEIKINFMIIGVRNVSLIFLLIKFTFPSIWLQYGDYIFSRGRENWGVVNFLWCRMC